jgi:hypothetical protein
MTEVVNDVKGQSDQCKEPPACIIPDVIEEKRKDSEGKIVINKYIRGKLLGKVEFFSNN